MLPDWRRWPTSIGGSIPTAARGGIASRRPFMAKAHSVIIVNGAWADGSSGNKLSLGLLAAAIRPIVIGQANRGGWSPFQKISRAQEYRP